MHRQQLFLIYIHIYLYILLLSCGATILVGKLVVGRFSDTQTPVYQSLRCTQQQAQQWVPSCGIDCPRLLLLLLLLQLLLLE